MDLSIDDRMASPRRRKSWFFRIAMPAIWLVAALFSWTHPGDEYGLFAVSCLPAAALAMPFASPTHFLGVLPILAAGVATMSLAGWLMDGRRVLRSVWLPLFVLGTMGLVWWGLSEFPSYARAMAKNGSLTAYVAAATNWSLYLSVVLSVAGSDFARRAFVARPRFCRLRQRGQSSNERS